MRTFDCFSNECIFFFDFFSMLRLRPLSMKRFTSSVPSNGGFLSRFTNEFKELGRGALQLYRDTGHILALWSMVREQGKVQSRRDIRLVLRYVYAQLESSMIGKERCLQCHIAYCQEQFQPCHLYSYTFLTLCQLL
jgi:hypothetical protein